MGGRTTALIVVPQTNKFSSRSQDIRLIHSSSTSGWESAAVLPPVCLFVCFFGLWLLAFKESPFCFSLNQIHFINEYFNYQSGKAVTDWINLIQKWCKSDQIMHIVYLWDSLSLFPPCSWLWVNPGFHITIKNGYNPKAELECMFNQCQHICAWLNIPVADEVKQ